MERYPRRHYAHHLMQPDSCTACERVQSPVLGLHSALYLMNCDVL